MTSREALENIRDYHNETVYDVDNIYTENMFEKELDIIEKGASKKFIDVDEDEESGVNVKITVMLKDFIDNNEEVIKLIKDCSTIVEQVNLIGKYLVSKKLNDSIDTETFKSLFYQCIIYGADDETLKKFYKILF